MILKDISSISSQRVKTDEGFLLVPAKVARTGVQEYNALFDFAPNEIPEEKNFSDSNNVVRLLRVSDEVFNKDALLSCANRPVTDGHPKNGFVDSFNVRDLQVGFSRDDVRQDGDAVAIDLVIQAEEIIKKIEDEGVNQISLGYSTDIDWANGVHPEFGKFDGIQRNIRCNHIALVKSGRAGPGIKISDEKTGGKKMATRVIDGITIEVTDQSGEAIDKLQSELEDAFELASETEKQLKDTQKENERLKGELDAEKAKALKVADVDSLVANRLQVIDSARALHSEIDPSNKSEHEIRVEAVQKTDSSFDLKDKSEKYVKAVFDTLVKTHKVDGSNLGDDLKALGTGVTALQDARKKFRESRMAAWRE